MDGIAGIGVIMRNTSWRAFNEKYFMLKKIILICIFLFLGFTGYGQNLEGIYKIISVSFINGFDFSNGVEKCFIVEMDNMVCFFVLKNNAKEIYDSRDAFVFEAFNSSKNIYEKVDFWSDITSSTGNMDNAFIGKITRTDNRIIIEIVSTGVIFYKLELLDNYDNVGNLKKELHNNNQSSPPSTSTITTQTNNQASPKKPTFKRNIFYFNGGFSAQYTALDGFEAKGRDTESSFRGNFEEMGRSGINTFGLNAFIQLGLDFGVNNLGFAMIAEINGGVGFGGETYGTCNDGNWGRYWSYIFLAELYHTKSIGLGFGYGVLNMATPLFNRVHFEDAYEYSYPFLRSEFLLVFPEEIPVTAYVDYYFQHKAFGGGIRINFNPRK